MLLRDRRSRNEFDLVEVLEDDATLLVKRSERN